MDFEKITFDKVLDTRQHLFVNITPEIREKIAGDIFEVLIKDNLYIDLSGLEILEELLNEIYYKFHGNKKLKSIIDSLNIKKEDFVNYCMFGYFLEDISSELEPGDIKIIFDNIDLSSNEIKGFINSMISNRERKIIYVILGNLDKYVFHTGLEGVNIREGDDYKLI